MCLGIHVCALCAGVYMCVCVLWYTDCMCSLYMCTVCACSVHVCVSGMCGEKRTCVTGSQRSREMLLSTVWVQDRPPLSREES